MESGQVFKVDQEAVEEMAKFFSKSESYFEKLLGLEFSIAKSDGAITQKLVRASKWVDGKPQRGRPTKFPRVTVARLLGEDDDASFDDSDAGSLDSVTTSENTPVDSVDSFGNEDEVESQEELESRAAALISDEGNESGDQW